MSIEAMKEALEALKYHMEQTRPINMTQNAIHALRQAIEQAELAKPVAWVETNDLVCALLRQAHDVLACASHPFKRPWVGLAEEEIVNAYEVYAKCQEEGMEISGWVDFYRAIEAKLKEKNGGS